MMTLALRHAGTPDVRYTREESGADMHRGTGSDGTNGWFDGMTVG